MQHIRSGFFPEYCEGMTELVYMYRFFCLIVCNLYARENKPTGHKGFWEFDRRNYMYIYQSSIVRTFVNDNTPELDLNIILPTADKLLYNID